ncbi:MAG: Gfo/Idh/MocA family oxidoreductase [Verrucomicrobiota bacterium]|jgi:predicted dehydrogenase
MNENETNAPDFNRRDFLKGGSVATLMTMLGGVELLAQTNAEPAAAQSAAAGPKVKVALVGLGLWGREILNTLARVPQAELAAICDTYPAAIKRCARDFPNVPSMGDGQTILANQDIPAVVIATPTHRHKDLVLAALKAGKHVYCEAPLAHTMEDARAIALAAKAARQSVFQAGLQARSDPQQYFVLKFIRAGNVGQAVLARAQWHKKTSWHVQSANAEREKELNWRLDKSISLGLVGEVGCHAIDQTAWFLNAKPRAVSGFGSLLVWSDDGRDVPDTVQAAFEFPGGVRLIYDATLGNSFDGAYEMLYGANAAVMFREGKAWMFKEVDSPLFGWEVYAGKDQFYKETGITLVVDASKPKPPAGQVEDPITSTPLFFALQNFVRNAIDVSQAKKSYLEAYGDADPEGLNEHLAKEVQRRPAAGYLEGFQAAVTVIKANEAILSGQRVLIQPELYELS